MTYDMTLEEERFSKGHDPLQGNTSSLHHFEPARVITIIIIIFIIIIIMMKIYKAPIQGISSIVQCNVSRIHQKTTVTC